jgi:hypothetical protein
MVIGAAAVTLLLAFGPGVALAQDMPPDHGTAASAPLFVPDLAVGTISVRITSPSMNEPFAGVEVTGTWTLENGKEGRATAKSGADGRALFANVPAGATFSATAEVEGKTMTTEEFEVPAEGGTRLLMIVGSGAGAAMAGMTGHPGGMGAGRPAPALRGGKVEASDKLPAGVVEIKVTSADGTPIAGQRVELARAKGSELQVERADTDATGVARFAKLATGSGHPWAAVLERDGTRIGSLPFELDDKRGAAGELHLPGKTSDLGVLRVADDSRIMLELREDSIAFLQNLIVENTSDKIFEPGPAGLLVPLPDGCTGAEKLPGGANVELKEGTGAIVRTPLPPTSAAMGATQVRVGCVIATRETPEVEIVQPMPLGLQGAFAMIPALKDVALSAPGIRPRPSERGDSGVELRTYELDSLAPGQPLRLTVVGLPTRSQAGKWIALALVGLLVGAGIAAVRRRRPATGSDA